MEISARLLGFTAYGVQWVLWLLIFLSVISIGMMLERLWYFATYRPSAQALAAQIRTLLHSGPSLRGGNDGAAAAEALAAAVEGATVRQRLQLERNLAFLGTLGSNAPFIGLFGTVLGIIKAFHDLAGNQAGGPAVVMAGISEALVATAVGLMVAIPAVVAFNYFNRRVRTSMTQVDWMAHLALAAVKAEHGEIASGPAVASPEPARSAPPAASMGRRLLPIAAVGGLVLFSTGLLIGRNTSRGVPQVRSAPPPSNPMVPTATSPTGLSPIPLLPSALPPAGTPPLAMAVTAPLSAGTPLTAKSPVGTPAEAIPPGAVPPAAMAPAVPAPVALAPAAPASAGKTAAGNSPLPPAPIGSKPTKQWKGKKRRPSSAVPPGSGSPKGPPASPAPAQPEPEQPKSPAPAQTAEPAAPTPVVP